MLNKGREKALSLDNWKLQENGIHVTTHSITDKLTGINSISTNCKSCGNCIYLHDKGLDQKAQKDILKAAIDRQEERIKRQLEKPEESRNHEILEDAKTERKALIKAINKIKVLVCAYCFANTTIERRPSVEDALQRNTEILTKRLLDPEEIPFFNRVFFRFESFGDLHNAIQAQNYITIAARNTHCNFAWWTKRPQLIKKAMENMGIEKLPENIIVIFSSYYVNHINTEISGKYDFIKVIFTVFDKYYLEEHPEITIHCGSRQCMGCLKCYTRRQEVIYINELVK